MTMAESTKQTHHDQYIGGAWVPAADGKTFEDRSPYTGQVLGTVAAATREDAKRAVEAASAAFPAWAATPPAARQRIFLAAADILERRRDEVVGLLATETGCTFGFAMFQMGFMPGLFRHAAGLAYNPIGQVIPSDVPGTFALTTNTDKGLALVDRIEAGIIHINDQTIGDEPQMPFGGVKNSGWGRFGGAAALDEFSELKWVTVQSGSHPYPF